MTTIPPTQDRDYYRSMSTKELLDAVRYAIPDRINWQEMCVALSERLYEAHRAIEDGYYDEIARREGY